MNTLIRKNITVRSLLFSTFVFAGALFFYLPALAQAALLHAIPTTFTSV